MAVSWLVLHITDRCQLNCKHCLRDPDKSAHDIELALFERLLDEAKSIYNCDHIGLTGGEPTLHPEFEKLLDAIVDRGMTWHMVTNGARFEGRVGTLFDADPRKKDSCTAIDFSIDGADATVHDHIRGAGSYLTAMGSIAQCHMRGIPFMLQMTINAYNQHQLEQYALGAAELGATRVSFGMTMPTGTYLDKEMFLSRDQWRVIQDRLDRLKAMLTVPVTYTEGFHNPRPFHECEPFRSEILHVDYEGRMNLCCMHAGVPGQDKGSSNVADMNKVSLATGHREMMKMVQQFREDKLSLMEAQGLSGWDEYPCTYCLKYFEKPHWTDQGASGEVAKRQRWKGAWAPEKHVTNVPLSDRLPILR